MNSSFTGSMVGNLEIPHYGIGAMEALSLHLGFCHSEILERV